MLTLPNGRSFTATILADADTLAGDELGASFLQKLKKVGKKAGKGALKPLQFAHKITHKGPLGKLERKVQDIVGKALPFTKPFIQLHNSVASPVHKAIETGKIKKALTAKAIKQITKDIPNVAQRVGVQTALAAQIGQTNALKEVAAKVVKAKVLAAAKGKAPAKAKAKAKAKALPAGSSFRVTLPSGRTVLVPASKVSA